MYKRIFSTNRPDAEVEAQTSHGVTVRKSKTQMAPETATDWVVEATDEKHRLADKIVNHFDVS